MPERFAGVLAGHGEHVNARGPPVCDDDLGLARIAVPLERDRVTSIVACVELHKHAGLLAGFGVCRTAGGGQRDLTASSVRLLVRGRARVLSWVRHRDRPLRYRVARSQPGRQAGVTVPASICNEEVGVVGRRATAVSGGPAIPRERTPVVTPADLKWRLQRRVWQDGVT